MRAQYEEAIAANQAKAAVYGFQSDLQKMDGRWLSAFEAFISTQYPRSSQDALNKDVDEMVSSPERATALKGRIRAAFK